MWIRLCGHGLRCHSPWLVHLCSLPHVTRPSYLTVTCSVCRLRSTRFGFSGRFFQNYSCIQHSLVRQRIHAVRQSTVFFIFYVNWWIMDPHVDSRPALFQCLLGSTADTCGASVYGVFHILRDLVDYGSSGRFSTCSFSAFAWFHSEYKFMRQSTWLVFLVTMHLALFLFFPVLRPLMLDIMAGMDQKDSFLRGAAHHRGHSHPLRGAEFGSHGSHCSTDHEIPRLQFLDKD